MSNMHSKVYIIDRIGNHSGMHLYDNSFVNILSDNDFDCTVISNYQAKYSVKLLKNFYNGNFFLKILRLISSVLSCFSYLIFKRPKCLVYNSFGMGTIDIIFILLFWWRRNFIVLIHDVNPIQGNDSRLSAFLRKFVYRYLVRMVIVHSERSIEELSFIGYTGTVIHVPIFKQCLDQVFDIENVGDDIVNAFDQEKINYLFFGVLRKTKGFDLLLSAINSGFGEIKNINIIVAGKDYEDVLTQLKQSDASNLSATVVCIDRYVNDDELVYLFKNSKFLLLPYRNIYQSAVVDLAINFRKPFIASNIPYFVDLISCYTSFGVTFEIKSAEDFYSVIKQTSMLDENLFYHNSDVELYYQYNEYSSLIETIRAM